MSDRYDELLVETFRPDGSLRYLIRQRNLSGRPHNLVVECTDKRTREEARDDWETLREHGVPAKPEVPHSFLLTANKAWRAFAGDDGAYLVLGGMWRMSGALANLQPLPDSSQTVRIGVGRDNGSVLALDIGNEAIVDPRGISVASTSMVSRRTRGDTAVHLGQFGDEVGPYVYEAGLFFGEELICRHVLSRPVCIPDRHRISLTFHLVSG